MKSAIVLRIYFLFSFITALLFFSCNTRYTSWQYNQTVHQIGFEKIRYLLKEGDTLSIIGYLNENTEIEKYPCATDWVHFSKDWKLKFFV